MVLPLAWTTLHGLRMMSYTQALPVLSTEYQKIGQKQGKGEITQRDGGDWIDDYGFTWLASNIFSGLHNLLLTVIVGAQNFILVVVAVGVRYLQQLACYSIEANLPIDRKDPPPSSPPLDPPIKPFSISIEKKTF